MTTIMIQGLLSDGLSSATKEARLSLQSENLAVLSVDEETITLAPESVKASSRLGNSARYIELGEHGRFETRDNDGVDALLAQLHQDDKSNFIHKLESNIKLIGIAILCTIAFSYALVRWGVPVASDYVVDMLPEKTSDILEEKILQRVENEWFEPSKLNEARQQEIQALFTQVLEELEINNPNYTLKIRDAEDSVGANALAFPSGTIVMTDQLTTLATDNRQIAGVLAHEVGHLDGKHSIRQLVRGSILSFFVAFIAGDVSTASSALIAAPVLLLELRYSREFETEADEYALAYFGCDEAGLNLMGDFFQSLSEPTPITVDGVMKEVQSDEEQSSSTERPTSNDTVSTDGTEHNKQKTDHSEDEDNFKFPEFLASHPLSDKRSKMFSEHLQKNCMKTN